MLNEKELKVLACFFPKLETLTLKQIGARSDYSHEPAFRIVEGLVKKSALQKSRIGKTNIYKFIITDDALLVFTFYTSRRIHELKQREPKVFKRLKEFISAIKSDCTVLFGSYAKGTQTPSSDIDLLCISAAKGIERIAAQFKTKYDTAIRPVVVSPKQFGKIKQENLTFYNDLVEYGIVLDGVDFFFKKVYLHGP